MKVLLSFKDYFFDQARFTSQIISSPITTSDFGTIIGVSVVCGILIVIAIGFFCYKCGFFKRKSNAERQEQENTNTVNDTMQWEGPATANTDFNNVTQTETLDHTNEENKLLD